MERRAGFEPATSRVADEVTAIFTTGRVWSWRGTGDAVAALKGNPELRHFSRQDTNPRPPSANVRPALYRSNRHLHHRRPMQCIGFEGHAGERAISASVTSTQARLAEHLRCGAWLPLVRAPPQCVSQRRESNPLFQGTKYPVSSPPASVEPHALARMRQTENCLRRLPRRIPANSEESALPSVSGSSPRSLRQAPRAWARAFPREPRDPGLPFRLSPAKSNSASVRCRRATKNPPEHLAREGSHQFSELSISSQARSPPK